ncbi:hypothetical protein C7212DRAFT_346066 [Tuber magnatum]|uniref:ER transporter 6TM N-terminal domain-containing protein n=1 Tax=Tuber magnatum TaxID=42249 RepID=A0A317SJV2_9PEZI|nr:hypothetical protein C7212DRAFT_346066 [Tuber magnatum]
MAATSPCRKRWLAVREELTRDRLPTRIFKCVLATTLTGHPGRRLGSMVESLTLASLGASIGIGWASLAVYLGSLVHPHSERGMMTIRATFLTISLFVHGYVRSSTPRLFILVLLMVIPVVIGLLIVRYWEKQTSPIYEMSTIFPKQFFFPILTASAIVLLVNVAVFPEFGSTYLGLTTIETLQKTLKVQKDASQLFLAYRNRPTPDIGGNSVEKKLSLKDLTETKGELRKKVTECKGALIECSFELAFSVLAPWELKPIASKGIKKLVTNTLSLVGACESKYALLGDGGATDSRAAERKHNEKKRSVEGANIDQVRPRKEIESGDQQLLRYLLERCVKVGRDVPTLPSLKQGTGTPRRPKGILLQELDVHIDWLENAIEEFGRRSTEALEGAAIKEINNVEMIDEEIDVMPRDEIFLISSFMLNLRQAASHTLDMLKYSRKLVELHKDRQETRRIWFPKIKVRKWLFSGTEEPESLPAAKRDAYLKEGGDPDEDEMTSGETLAERKDRGRKKGARERVAHFLEWASDSDDVLYAFKLTLGVMLVTWPAFVSGWQMWFYHNRGLWVGLIFILVFENAIGSTIWIFALRAVGTLIGSVWGYAAYEARNGNDYYVQLGTRYMKAGMICTISMCVVAVSTHLQTVPGSSQENFTKRSVTMLIGDIHPALSSGQSTNVPRGGAAATLVQMIILPAKARVRLKESLASAIVQITKMETCIAYGVDDTRNIVSTPRLFRKFERAAKKAEAALTSAETFLGFTKQEPRLKGSFDTQEVVYKEIIFVLRQIVDKMENMLQMRKAYGSAVLEQYNSLVFSYRRNVAASVTLMLFACHEALTTKLPLPQFLPSARLAHLRMVVRVRQILLQEDRQQECEELSERLDAGAGARRRAFPKQFFFPILTASAIVLLVNVAVFPEFGSTYLGLTTIETLQKTLKVQKDASQLFLAYRNRPTPDIGGNSVEKKLSLKDLTETKGELRKKVTECKGALIECSFELAFSVLAPWELKPIASKGIKKLVTNTLSLVGACESKYALLGDGGATDSRAAERKHNEKKRSVEGANIDQVRPRKEIESGDQQLLRYLLERCVKVGRDVPTLPSLKQGTGTPRRPKGILLQELDVHIDWLENAIEEFGRRSTEALEGAAIKEINNVEMIDEEIDVMPRDEIFLISSFMLNLRQAASHTLDMLKYSRKLVELHKDRQETRRIWFPKIKVRKWLFSGTEEPESLPAAKRDAYLKEGGDPDEDEMTSGETLAERKDRGRKKGARERVAHFLEWASDSDDVLYAFKLTLGVMLVTWPAFVSGWQMWFYHNRGCIWGLITQAFNTPVKQSPFTLFSGPVEEYNSISRASYTPIRLLAVKTMQQKGIWKQNPQGVRHRETTQDERLKVITLRDNAGWTWMRIGQELNIYP